MKTAFSTLGCPGWEFNEIFATAKDLGFDGIEIRGIADELYAPKAKPFLPEHIEATVARFRAAGMEIPMLTTNAGLCVDGDCGLAEAEDYARLAQRLGCRYIRVMTTKNPQPEGEINLEQTARQYAALCDKTAPYGVSPLLETNGALADTGRMKELMERAGRPNAGVLWDIHHPYRYFDECPAVSAANLKGLVKYVHVKDSVMKDGVVKYRMMGYGDVPVLDCLSRLKQQGYDGYVSLEWVKRWNPDLQEPGIVFAHYASYISMLLRQI